MKYALGIDIGGTRTKMGLVQLESGKVENRVVYATAKDEKIFLDNLLTNARKCISQTDKDNVAGVGIAVSGFVHRESGTIDAESGSFLPFFASYPIEERIEELLSIPCKAENDAALACYGEALYGAGLPYNRVLMLTLGTGIGVGFVVGKSINKDTALIHRAGHIKVREGGLPCYCKVEGCLESWCSGSSLRCRASKIYGQSVDSEELFLMARQGEKQAEYLVEEYLDTLAEGLNQYIYLYAPDVIILGGGVAKSLGRYTECLKKKITAQVYHEYQTELCLSEKKEDAGILGGAALFK